MHHRLPKNHPNWRGLLRLHHEHYTTGIPETHRTSILSDKNKVCFKLWWSKTPLSVRSTTASRKELDSYRINQYPPLVTTANKQEGMHTSMMKRHYPVCYFQSVMISDSSLARTSELIDILAHSVVLCYFLACDMLYGPTYFKQSLSIRCRMEAKILASFEGASCWNFTRAFISPALLYLLPSRQRPKKISKQVQDK